MNLRCSVLARRIFTKRIASDLYSADPVLTLPFFPLVPLVEYAARLIAYSSLQRIVVSCTEITVQCNVWTSALRTESHDCSTDPSCLYGSGPCVCFNPSGVLSLTDPSSNKNVHLTSDETGGAKNAGRSEEHTS